MNLRIFASIIFIILLKNVRFCHSVRMNCAYKTVFAMKIGEVCCYPKNFHTTFEDRTVTNVISNDYDLGNIRDNVTSINIVLEDSPYLPLEIDRFFPNVVLLEIRNSNVQHLLTGDLDGFTKLKFLDLSDNPIEQISHDFFRGKFFIEVIYFYNCNLKKIDADAFLPLISLKTLLLKGNECIDKNFYINNLPPLSMRNEIKNAIIENCQGDHQQLKPQFKENCERKVEASGSSIDVFIIFTLIILAIILAGLSIVLIYTYRVVFKENWNQMRCFWK
ncbi:hypothetical protein PVAND_013201 [Polypedilum vanderplanki]|uniref:Uncharacterized protein n=1 Tax=Polypedilum vanderplanki TaxID=319348 RepID=A0A9J6CNX8_POLVA|nr:hypothetical protein PVAND_013201 [Polypedilum vanderplanki]